MGWLTESAFIPKESKKIQIEQSSSSMVTLKAKILEEKAKLTANKGINNGNAGLLKIGQKKDLFAKAASEMKNTGVEGRALRD